MIDKSLYNTKHLTHSQGLSEILSVVTPVWCFPWKTVLHFFPPFSLSFFKAFPLPWMSNYPLGSIWKHMTDDFCPRASFDSSQDNTLVGYLVVGQSLVHLGRVGSDLTSQNNEMLEQHLLDTQQLWELRSSTKMLAILKMFPGLTRQRSAPAACH